MRYIPPILGLEGWIASPPAKADNPCRNASDRFLLGENVEFLFRPRDVKIRKDQDVVQGDAMKAVRGVENYPQEFSIRGDLAANRSLHSLDACQGVGYGTDTADPRSDLRDLFHRLTYGEFLNTPDRGDGEPVSSLDNTLIIHLHGKL